MDGHPEANPWRELKFRAIPGHFGPPWFLPFADAATPDLPLGRLLRLSLFQVSVGMAMALLNGTLNRVMIVELGVATWLEGLNEQDVGGGRFADVVSSPGWSFRLLTILTLAPSILAASTTSVGIARMAAI